MPKGTIIPHSEIERHLLAYKSSNQSAAEYCRTHSIPISTFRGWRKRFDSSNNSVTNISKKDFLRVPVSSVQTEPPSSGTIRFSQLSVELSGEVSSSLAQVILEVLGHQQAINK